MCRGSIGKWAVNRGHYALISFGSVIHIKTDASFLAQNAGAVFSNLKSEFPKMHRRLCKSRGGSIGTHLDPPLFVA